MIKIFVEFKCDTCRMEYMLGIVGEKLDMRDSWLYAGDPGTDGVVKIRDSGMTIPECPWCCNYVKEEDCEMPVIVFDKEDM